MSNSRAKVCISFGESLVSSQLAAFSPVVLATAPAPAVATLLPRKLVVVEPEIGAGGASKTPVKAE